MAMTHRLSMTPRLSMRTLGLAGIGLGVAALSASACAPPPPSPSPTPDPPVFLDVRVAGRIGCAWFPYNCTAHVSVLPVDTVVDEDWRPPLDDTRWIPDYRGGTSADHFAPEPVGDTPVLPPGPHQVVVSLLGVTDVASFNPDGSEATSLLARCIMEVDAAGALDPVAVVVTFATDDGDSCAIEFVDR